MLRFLVLVLTIAAISGCSGRVEPVEPYQHRTHVLTPAQTTRQVELLKAAHLPYGCEKLVGKPVSDYDELLSLANGTFSRSTSTDAWHIFNVPGIGDGGSDGELIIVVDECKITQAMYSAAYD